MVTFNVLFAAGDSVKTSILRPPSKPRVRQPATMKLQQGEKKLKTSVNQQQVQYNGQLFLIVLLES